MEFLEWRPPQGREKSSELAVRRVGSRPRMKKRNPAPQDGWEDLRVVVSVQNIHPPGIQNLSYF